MVVESILRGAFKAGGLVTAPWWFLASRAFKSPALIDRAISADNTYGQALSAKVRLGSEEGIVLRQFQVAAQLVAAARSGSAGIIKNYISFSQSQILQDIVCVLAHNQKRAGYFVEVGVGDGEVLSNTHLLEGQLGWTGVLVEPNHSFHDAIVANRSVSMDRRAAASRDGESVTFHEFVGAGLHSRLADSSDEPDGETKTKTYSVETARLDTILEHHGAPSAIDFMTIDTEGSELDVLEGLSLDRYQIGFMAIEHNYQPRKVAAIKKRLEPFGYHQILPNVSGFDVWFVHESLSSCYID